MKKFKLSEKKFKWGYGEEDVKEFIRLLKDSKETIKEKIYYKSNNLDFKVGMIQGFEEAMVILENLAGEELSK